MREHEKFRMDVVGSVFHQCVSRILERWTALRIAVDQGFGGVDSQEKALWLIGVIVDFFHDNEDIESWELEEFLEDILNAEFNLVRDPDNDGTDISLVSSEVCKAFNLCRQGRSAEFLTHCQSSPCPLPPVVQHSQQMSAAAANTDSSDNETDSSQMAYAASNSSSRICSDVDQRRTTDCQSANVTTTSPASDKSDVDGRSAMEEDEGWTVVKRNRRT